MEQEINDIILKHNVIKDPIISEKIELYIQKLYNISIPSIILEYLSNENEIFEIEDLKQFFNHFGEVLNIVIIDKKSIVLFKTFFIANICKEFLQSEINYKENMKKNFNVRWFDFEKDNELIIPKIKPIFEEIYNKNIINLKPNAIDDKSVNNENNNIGIKMNMNMNINNFNINTNMNQMAQNQNMMQIQNLQYLQLLQFNKFMQNNYNNPQGKGQNMMPNFNIPLNPIQIQQHQNLMNQINMMNKQNLNNMNNQNNISMVNNIKNMNLLNNMNNNINMNNPLKSQTINIQSMNNNPQFNQYLIQENLNKNTNNINNNDEKNVGKFTCKYEILIANDKDFQIARRLIGSKGCNMKNIINECKSSGDGEGIKLRLRGKGSGYKEGPENKESDEPLHLCVSSKNPEEMKKACILVDELLDKIHQDYKEYCEKNNVTPLSTEIATRIENKNLNYKSK